MGMEAIDSRFTLAFKSNGQSGWEAVLTRRELQVQRAWQAFEADVAQTFRAAGYVTRSNVEYSGQEFDIIATKRSLGDLDVRIAVECKYKSAGSVSNDEVHEFVNAFYASARAHKLTWGMLVSNRGFSRQAHEAVRDHQDIRLITKNDLDLELLGGRTYLESTEAVYRSGVKGYIPLAGRKMPDARGSGVMAKDMAGECVRRMSGAKRTFTFLLGDFGSGKTTIAEQVHRLLAAGYLSGELATFPVILYLRTLEQHDSEDNFIESYLKLSSPEFGVSRLQRLQHKSPIAFILDGFDEVATNASEDERLRLFSRVMRLANRGHHVLITSRPSYFNNLEELNGLVDTLIERDFASVHKLKSHKLRRDTEIQIILDKSQAIARSRITGMDFKPFPRSASAIYFLCPLTKSDIIRYFEPHASVLLSRHRMTPTQVYEFLENVYDLSDLLTRPLLLEMFVELLLAGTVNLSDPDLQIGPAGLYHLYINLHLERDWGIRRFLTPDERLAFARAAAVAMLEAGGSLEATYDSIKDIVERGSEIFEPARRELLAPQMEGVVTDVRLCAFINITPRGRVEFSHKSFMEYFVADVIVGQLSLRRAIPLLRLNLNYEILYFLGSYCLVRGSTRLDLIQHLRDFGYSESEVYRSNLRLAILFSERRSVDRDFNGLQFTRVKIAKKRFESCTFTDVLLRSAEMFSVTFQACSFDAFRVHGDVADIRLVYSTGTLSLGSKPRHLRISECRHVSFIDDGLGQVTFQEAEWEHSAVELPTVCRMQDAVINRSRIVLAKRSRIILSNTRLKDSTIGLNHPSFDAAELPRLQTDGIKISSCLLWFVLVDLATFETLELLLPQFSGVLVVDDQEGRVQAFLHSDEEGVTRYRGWEASAHLLIIHPLVLAGMSRNDQASLTAVLNQGSSVLDWAAMHLRNEPIARGPSRGKKRSAPSLKQ